MLQTGCSHHCFPLRFGPPHKQFPRSYLQERVVPLGAAGVSFNDGHPKHPTNGLRGLPSRIWVWGWGHWAPRTWVSRTDLPTPTRAKQKGLPTTTDRTASKNAPGRQIQLAGPPSEKRYRKPAARTDSRNTSRLSNPARWAAKQKALPTTTDRNCSDGVERHSPPPNPPRWAPKQEGLATATAQTESKDTPSRQIHLAEPQSKKG